MPDPIRVPPPLDGPRHVLYAYWLNELADRLDEQGWDAGTMAEGSSSEMLRQVADEFRPAGSCPGVGAEVRRRRDA